MFKYLFTDAVFHFFAALGLGVFWQVAALYLVFHQEPQLAVKALALGTLFMAIGALSSRRI